jgi:hypothetical protein
MKKIYTTSIIVCVVLLLGCSKDFLKRYDKRIIGTWRISDINRNGFGGDIDNLPFQEGGRFTFMTDGSLTYDNGAGATFQGSWDIQKKYVGDGTELRTLQITAVDFTNQRVLSEYYDDMTFAGTDHFKARIYSGWHTYITHFRR